MARHTAGPNSPGVHSTGQPFPSGWPQSQGAFGGRPPFPILAIHIGRTQGAAPRVYILRNNLCYILWIRHIAHLRSQKTVRAENPWKNQGQIEVKTNAITSPSTFCASVRKSYSQPKTALDAGMQKNRRKAVSAGLATARFPLPGRSRSAGVQPLPQELKNQSGTQEKTIRKPGNQQAEEEVAEPQ